MMGMAQHHTMSKNIHRTPHGGVHSVQTERREAGLLGRWGRPVPERGTPVNMEKRLHCDNGEGVVATPLPYPPVMCRFMWSDN